MLTSDLFSIYKSFNAIEEYSGKWDEAGTTGAVCVHNILLPNERVLCMERPHVFPYPPNPFTKAALATEINLKGKVNPDGTWVSSWVTIPTRSNPFCGGHAQNANGSITIIGGDKTVWTQMDGTVNDIDGHFGRRVYNPCTKSSCSAGEFFEDVDMTTGRWYPTVVTMYDGRQIIAGGVTGNLDMNKPEGNNPTYEYYPSKKGAWPKPLDILQWCFPHCLYPLMLQMPSGNIMLMASNKTIVIDPRTEGIKFTIPDLIAPDQMPWQYPFTPTFTVLPMTIKNKHRYVVKICGGSRASVASTTKEASKQCWEIAPEEPNPRWKRGQDMPHARVMPDSVLLPDGKILYLNGAAIGTAGGLAGESSYSKDPILVPDLFDPEAPEGSQWRTLASAKYQRIYHSEANLVQSGHVIATGSEMLNIGDYWGGGNPDPKCFPKGNLTCTDPFNYVMERFTPPYLEQAAKTGRLEIVSAPARVNYRSDFDIQMKGNADKVKRVTIIRYSSTTHSTNTDQRFFELFIMKKSGDRVTVRSPWSSAIAPPGNWMIWALDEHGVPSESKTILLDISTLNNQFSFDIKDPDSLSSAPETTFYVRFLALSIFTALFTI